MKNILFRLLALFIYIAVLLGLFQFKVEVLFNFKMILMVVFGTIILTLSGYKKGNSLEELKVCAGWNAMLSAYLTTFILLFSRLSGSNVSNLRNDVAMNCRPLLYGLLLNILLKNDLNRPSKSEAPTQPPDIAPNAEDINTKLRAAALTDREIEIAVCIYNGLTNKEIGDRLFISVSTVKKHTSNFYKKLHVNSREQLRHFMIEPGSSVIDNTIS